MSPGHWLPKAQQQWSGCVACQENHIITCSKARIIPVTALGDYFTEWFPLINSFPAQSHSKDTYTLCFWDVRDYPDTLCSTVHKRISSNQYQKALFPVLVSNQHHWAVWPILIRINVYSCFIFEVKLNPCQWDQLCLSCSLEMGWREQEKEGGREAWKQGSTSSHSSWSGETHGGRACSSPSKVSFCMEIYSPM